ncbi:hypothetical protein [Epilithonimonas sp.]|uniref:transcriptional regulator n=1 Tax=Epilithonimonas sp. TaxID=2894511 RepID=UPI00289D1306|nr:hypothetical protein [Epilithonimonas sp.]
MVLSKKIIGILVVLSFLNGANAQQYATKKIDSLIALSFHLADRHQALQICAKTYQLSDAAGYYPGKAKSLNANINSYLGLGEHEKALRSANKLYEIASSEGDDYYMGQALIAQTLSYAYLGFFEKALKINKDAEVICSKIKDNDEFYSSLGQVYAGRAEIKNLQYKAPKEILAFQLKSLGFYKKIKNREKRNSCLATLYSSIAYTFVDLHKYKSAIDHNKKAYVLAKLENDSINQAYGLYGLGRAFMDMNKSDSSVYYYKKALVIFQKANDVYRLQNIYDYLASIYDKKNNDKIYSNYSKKARELSEIIRKKEKIETYRLSDSIIQAENLNWYRSFYIFVGCVIFLIAIFVFFTLKYFKSYKKEKEQKESLKDELIQKEKKLSHLELKINDAFAELLELAKNNDSSFLTRFKEVYPYFYNQLVSSYPELTTGQLQFCAMLRLNFTTKEIANYNNISVRSVETRKNRLRKLMNIPSDVDLNKWMMDF